MVDRARAGTPLPTVVLVRRLTVALMRLLRTPLPPINRRILTIQPSQFAGSTVALMRL